MKKLTLILAMLLVCPLAAQEQLEPDEEGCKDSTVLTRMKSCRIYDCVKKDFDAATLRVGRDSDSTKTVEGEVDTITYDCLENVSYLAIVRNAEKALKAAGFKTLYSGGGDDDRPVYVAQKGGIFVSLMTGEMGRPGYTQIVVRNKEMEQEMVADAAAMEAEISSTGYCSIYGILFDTGKASIQPESAKCLTEVGTLLKKNATWKMQIEGHTDNVGAKDVNLKLSQSRADAVRSWLVFNGIEGARLTAKGFGDTKPKLDNDTEDGRSKNRRVDLRKL